MPSIPIFVTGTDTDIGKTFISSLLVKRWGANYWKPIQTGLEEDCGDTVTIKKLLSGSGGAPEETIIFQPALEYQKPLSPWRCTVLEKTEKIEIETLKVPETSNGNHLTIVEGAGGILVPINEKQYTTSLIKHLKCAATIVVARSELGTLNHTLMTLEILRNNDIHVLGVILNGEINEDNATTLKALGVNIIAQVPKTKNLNDVLNNIPPIEQLLKNLPLNKK